MPLWESKNSHDCKCNLYLNFFLTLKVLQRRFIHSPFGTILSSGIVVNTSFSCPRIAEGKQDWEAPYLLQHISITRTIQLDFVGNTGIPVSQGDNHDPEMWIPDACRNNWRVQNPRKTQLGRLGMIWMHRKLFSNQRKSKNWFYWAVGDSALNTLKINCGALVILSEKITVIMFHLSIYLFIQPSSLWFLSVSYIQ